MAHGEGVGGHASNCRNVGRCSDRVLPFLRDKRGRNPTFDREFKLTDSRRQFSILYLIRGPKTDVLWDGYHERCRVSTSIPARISSGTRPTSGSTFGSGTNPDQLLHLPFLQETLYLNIETLCSEFCLKKILAILSITFLLTASVASYAQYCVFAYKVCQLGTASESQCPHEAAKAEPEKVTGCGGEPRCRAAESCGQQAAADRTKKCNGEKNCGDEKDCKPKLCKISLPLESDRPNRTLPQTPPAFACGFVQFQPSLHPFDYESSLAYHPPRGVHLSIATSVLRI